MGIAKRISSAIGEQDILARIGHNKFAVVLLKVGDRQRANSPVAQIQQQFDSSFNIARERIKVNLNIGSAIYKPAYQKPNHILRDAKLALRQAQKQGKNTYCLSK